MQTDQPFPAFDRFRQLARNDLPKARRDLDEAIERYETHLARTTVRSELSHALLLERHAVRLSRHFPKVDFADVERAARYGHFTKRSDHQHARELHSDALAFAARLDEVLAKVRDAVPGVVVEVRDLHARFDRARATIRAFVEMEEQQPLDKAKLAQARASLRIFGAPGVISMIWDAGKTVPDPSQNPDEIATTFTRLVEMVEAAEDLASELSETLGVAPAVPQGHSRETATRS